MNQNDMKKAAAMEALKYVQKNAVLGVGTGSTIGYFIDALAEVKECVPGVVSSSEATTRKLKTLGIPVLDLNDVGHFDVYVDGADEINDSMQMIKGGGGALTREKIAAACANTFVCVVDRTKQVNMLGTFPLPVEVIPMAVSYVADELRKIGGNPRLRSVYTTDNGNMILDVHGLKILDPTGMEELINNIPGVVTVGLFARRGADILIVGDEDGVKIQRSATVWVQQDDSRR